MERFRLFLTAVIKQEREEGGGQVSFPGSTGLGEKRAGGGGEKG